MKGAERFVLEPLSLAAVAEVARDVMQAEPDESLLRVAGQAGGNPFLLVELLEGLREEGLIRVDAGRATLIDNRLPDRVSTSMRERLDRMADSARQVATVAGSLGRAFSVSDVATMLGLPPASVLTSSRGADRGRHRDRARRPARVSARSGPRSGTPGVSPLGPPGARSPGRGRDAGQGGVAGRSGDPAGRQRRAGGRGGDHDAPGGGRGAGDDRSRSERRPQPAGPGDGPREASSTRSRSSCKPRCRFTRRDGSRRPRRSRTTA